MMNGLNKILEKEVERLKEKIVMDYATQIFNGEKTIEDVEKKLRAKSIIAWGEMGFDNFITPDYIENLTQEVITSVKAKLKEMEEEKAARENKEAKEANSTNEILKEEKIKSLIQSGVGTVNRIGLTNEINVRCFFVGYARGLMKAGILKDNLEIVNFLKEITQEYYETL